MENEIQDKLLYLSLKDKEIVFKTEEFYEEICTLIHNKYLGNGQQLKIYTDQPAPIIEMLHSIQEDLILIIDLCKLFFPKMSFLDGKDSLGGLEYFCSLSKDEKSFIEVSPTEIKMYLEGEPFYTWSYEEKEDYQSRKSTYPFISVIPSSPSIKSKKDTNYLI